MTLIEQLAQQFPRNPKGRQYCAAVTGWIPMKLFKLIEKDIRKEFNGKYRIVYRGPRTHPSFTHRDNATHVVIYHKN